MLRTADRRTIFICLGIGLGALQETVKAIAINNEARSSAICNAIGKTSARESPIRQLGPADSAQKLENRNLKQELNAQTVFAGLAASGHEAVPRLIVTGPRQSCCPRNRDGSSTGRVGRLTSQKTTVTSAGLGHSMPRRMSVSSNCCAGGPMVDRRGGSEAAMTLAARAR